MRSLDDYKNAIGFHIRAERIARGLSQVDLSRISGVARSYISSLERGEGNPSLDLLFAVCNALHVDIESLISPI